MFKITPIQDKDSAISYIKQTGAEYIEGAFVYAMNDVDSGELMGISQFEINSDSGYIYDIKSKIGYDDFEAMFILGRQTMNFIDKCGIHACKASKNAGDESLIKSIGFVLKDGIYYCDMTGMFDGNCAGHKKD